MDEKEQSSKRFFVSVFTPLLLALAMVFIKLFESVNGVDLYKFSIEPRTIHGLAGILFAPLLHANWEHLGSNIVPFFVLFSGAIYFYRIIAYKVFALIWLLDGVGVWLLGRDSYHLGASGVIYGLASFLFFSGVLRKNRSLLALSLVVIAMYGGLIWGILPYVYTISWEAHFFGLLSGIGLAVWYRKRGPEDDKVPEWFNEEEQDDGLGEEMTEENIPGEGPRIIIKYNYKPDDRQENEG